MQLLDELSVCGMEKWESRLPRYRLDERAEHEEKRVRGWGDKHASGVQGTEGLNVVAET